MPRRSSKHARIQANVTTTVSYYTDGWSKFLKCCSSASLVNQTLSSGWRLSIRNYKRPLRKGLENFHSMTCSTDIQILCIVDWRWVDPKASWLSVIGANAAKSLMLSLAMEELRAFCDIRAYYTQLTGLWVTQRQSIIYKICISVEQVMLWKFSRPFPRGRL